MFHLVSLSLQGFFLPGKFDFNLMLIPVVDRPCLALVRQCRKKNVHDLSVVFPLFTHDNQFSGTMTATIVMMSAASVQKKSKCSEMRK